MDYSFARLSKFTQKHLPFLALFSERFYGYWISIFGVNPKSDFGCIYKAVFGENIQAVDWQNVFDEATEAGILEQLCSNVYKIHPALPWFLRQKLNEISNQETIHQLEKQLLIFYAALAEYYDELWKFFNSLKIGIKFH